MKCPYCHKDTINIDAVYHKVLQYNETKFQARCWNCHQKIVIEVGIKVSRIPEERPE